MINKKIMISIFLICLCVFSSFGTQVKMVYPFSNSQFCFETDDEYNGKRIRYIVDKNIVLEDKFRKMYVTVLQAQATGFSLWVGHDGVSGTHDGRPKSNCTSLSINK